jgi:hypothetical protein
MYLLAHGGNQITAEAAYRCDGTFGIVSGTKPQLVPSPGGKRGIRNDLHNLKDVGLLDMNSTASTAKSYPELTEPFAARSSPRLIVVPTATNSLLPFSVLDVSSVTQDTAFMDSFVANS